ncbi:metallophosphoesterase family protein [Methylopila turkensis]|uniref:metallophosphoesterase family protein n=1 Tax=Methylopila turkensis TaxID=1437816 RepID=UPI0022F3224A|nr:DNA repair exonuclease [Methylopila turkensis]
MTSFRFLHAADVHLDSPLHGLSRYEGLPADEIRAATRAAFDNLVGHAIAEAVDFVLIAGDLFDGEWRDMSTGLYLARALGRLDQAGVAVFILAGNHDATSVITRNVPWPPNVRQFGSREPETHRLDELGVAIHGQSFATAAVTANLAAGYPAAESHMFNIGMLHTALAGRRGHAAYAPCSVEDLSAKGYDYWALGHVHEHEIVSREPWIVFPGAVQGRTIRETGPKGAVVVTVTDREIRAVEHVPFDVVRWTSVELDCGGASFDDFAALARAALRDAKAADVSGGPLIVRLTLVGATSAAGAYHDAAEQLRNDARAIAASLSPDLFVEKVRVAVTAPATAQVVTSGDLSALIDEAASDAALVAVLQADLDRFLGIVEGAAGPAEDGALRRAAAGGDWPTIVRTASLALRARLAERA